MRRFISSAVGLGLVISIFLLPQASSAHCDTMNGPVVITAQAALEKGEVTPVLKWVKKEDEQAIRDAFQQTMTVRSKGPEAKALADRYFFETLVRIHRAGEGAPFTGLKSGKPEEIILTSDNALDHKSSTGVIKQVNDAVSQGIQHRYERVLEARKHADESVEAGREFVEAYVQYTHYVERLYQDASTSPAHHAEADADSETEHHE